MSNESSINEQTKSTIIYNYFTPKKYNKNDFGKLNTEIIKTDQQRKIPMNDNFMKKEINDIVYGYLQCSSFIGYNVNNELVRFVYKPYDLLNIISKKININKRTLRRKIDILIEKNYIYESKITSKDKNEFHDAYIFVDSENYFQYVNLRTLQYLTDTSNDFVIKTFCYLANKYQNFKNYNFTLDELIKNCLGLESSMHKRERDRIKNILLLLEKLNLIAIGQKRILINNTFTYRYYIINIYLM